MKYLMTHWHKTYDMDTSTNASNWQDKIIPEQILRKVQLYCQCHWRFYTKYDLVCNVRSLLQHTHYTAYVQAHVENVIKII